MPTCGIHRITTEIVQLRDGELETSVISREIGLAVRVIVDGTWGFASHAELAPRSPPTPPAARCRWRARWRALNAETRRAGRRSRSTATLSWVSSYQIDPFDVAAADKIAVLQEYSGGCWRPTASTTCRRACTAVKEQTFYADMYGSSITQQRVRVLPSLEAVAVDTAAGSFDSMRTLAPPTARGLGGVVGDEIWDWSDELARAAVAAGREGQGAERRRRDRPTW